MDREKGLRNVLSVLSLVFLLIIGVALTNGLTGCGGGTSSVLISITALDTFDPQIISVNSGSTVRWTNNDTEVHTVTTDANNTATGGPDSDSVYPDGIPAGSSYEWTTPAGMAAGTNWYYHCRFHGTAGDGSSLGTGMAGVITVQ